MQLKLPAGRQAKLIKSAKQRNNLTWKALSELIGYSEGYLKNELQNEKTLISDKTYEKLCRLSGLNFDCLIQKRLDKNWGRSKGGKHSVPKPRAPKLIIDCQSAELAEAIGILIGDGNIWVKPGYYYLRITFNLDTDRKYALNHVLPLFKKIFGIQLNVYRYPHRRALVLSKADKDLVHTLLHFGLCAGNKKGNNIKIPDWVFESRDYLKACIRGLIDTDGSVCPITGRKYSYIWFSSGIPALRNSFSSAMSDLNIKI